MLSMLSRLIGSTLINFVGVYIAGKILDKPYSLLKNKNNIIYILLMGTVTTFVFLYADGILRAMLNVFLIAYGLKTIFNCSFRKSFKISILLMLMTVISETICVIVMLFILNTDLTVLNENVSGRIIANFLVSAELYLIYRIFEKKIKQFFNKYDLGKVSDTLLIIVSLVLSIIYIYQNFRYELDNVKAISNIIVILTMISLVYIVFSEKLKNKIAKDERNILEKNMTIYEKTVEKLRISQHENKNELSVIKNMLLTNDSKLKLYVDSLLSDKKIDDDVEVMLKLKKINSAVIKSLLYEKTNRIYNKNISLIIDVNVTEDALVNSLTIGIEKDLCRILGVLMDNAIECVKKNKNYQMGIFLFSDKETFGFDVFNNYDSIGFLEKPNNNRLFLMNSDHGNGLKLVNKIIQKHNKLLFRTEVDEQYINQKIIYKEHTKSN